MNIMLIKIIKIDNYKITLILSSEMDKIIYIKILI